MAALRLTMAPAHPARLTRTAFDTDGDTDVDLFDFGAMQRVITVQ